MPRTGALFSKNDLLAALRHQEQKVKQEIVDIPANELLNTSTEDLVTFLAEKFKIETPSVRKGEVTTEQVDAEVGTPDWRTRGTVVTFYIPFDGDTLSPPYGEVRNGELQLIFEVRDHKGAGLKSQFEHQLGEIVEHLTWIENDVAPFNERLPHLAREEVKRRREKLLKDRGLVAELGYPRPRALVGHVENRISVRTSRRSADLGTDSAKFGTFVARAT